MMNFDYFISLIKDPAKVQEKDQIDLLKLCYRYPYFGLSRWLYLKSLKNSNSINYKKELKMASLHAPDRKKLYFFIHPEELKTERRIRSMNSGSYFDVIDNYTAETNQSTAETTDSTSPNSLQALAKRLKEARSLLHQNKDERTEGANMSQEPQIVEATAIPIPSLSDSEQTKIGEETIIVPQESNMTPTEEIESSKPMNEDIKEGESENIQMNAETLKEKENHVKSLVKEQKYKDAITLLEQLILINPKKSVYFADQIQFLQKILEYNQ